MTRTDPIANKRICTVGSGFAELWRIMFVWVSSDGGCLLTVLAALGEKSLLLEACACLEHGERLSVCLGCQPDGWEPSSGVCVCVLACADSNLANVTFSCSEMKDFEMREAFKNFFLGQTGSRIVKTVTQEWLFHLQCEKQRITWGFCFIYYLGLVQERSLYMTPPPQVREQSDQWDQADHWPWTALGPCSPNLTHWPLRHHWRKKSSHVKEDAINTASIWPLTAWADPRNQA